MARRPIDTRKRRTREHVIADLSVHHVEGFILRAGHFVQEVSPDFGYDLTMRTFDTEGQIEWGQVYWQLKASERWVEVADHIPFDLDVRDYNLYLKELYPVILVLYDASKRRALWLHVQGFFRDRPGRGPRPGAKTVRVLVPSRQVMNGRAIERIRRLKRATRLPFEV